MTLLSLSLYLLADPTADISPESFDPRNGFVVRHEAYEEMAIHDDVAEAIFCARGNREIYHRVTGPDMTDWMVLQAAERIMEGPSYFTDMGGHGMIQEEVNEGWPNVWAAIEGTALQMVSRYASGHSGAEARYALLRARLA